MSQEFTDYVIELAKNNDLEITKILEKKREKLKEQQQNARWFSYPFTFISALGLSIIAAVGTGGLFPALAWWTLGVIGVLGFVLDAIVFRKSVAKTFELFRRGIIHDIRDNTYQDNLLKNEDILSYIDSFIDYKKLEAKIRKKYENIDSEKAAELRVKRLFAKKKEALRKKKCAQLILKAALLRARTIDDHMIKTGKSRRQAEKDWRAELKTEDKKSFVYFCQALEDTKKTTRSLWVGKSILVGVGSFFPIGVGVAFGAMAAIHILELATVYLALSLSGGVVITAALGAAFLGFTYMLLMYKHLYSAVTKNVFMEMWKKLRIDLTYWKDMDFKDKVADVVGNVIKVTLGVFVLAIGVVAIVFSAGALIDATFSVTIGVMTWAKGTLAPFVVEKVALWTNIVMSILILPMQLIFGITHSLGATEKLSQGVKGIANIVREKKYTEAWEDIKNNPIKAPLYAFGFLFAFGALIVHIVTEAIAFSGEGASSDVAWTGTTYQNITGQFMSETVAVNTIVAASTLSELASHGDFLIADAKDKEFSITRSPYDLTQWLKNKFTNSCLLPFKKQKTDSYDEPEFKNIVPTSCKV